jgi:hypothetical protein
VDGWSYLNCFKQRYFSFDPLTFIIVSSMASVHVCVKNNVIVEVPLEIVEKIGVMKGFSQDFLNQLSLPDVDPDLFKTVNVLT